MLKEKKSNKNHFFRRTKKYVSSIDREGLISKSRLYVHLSDNMETAIKVGKRHGKKVDITLSLSNRKISID